MMEDDDAHVAAWLKLLIKQRYRQSLSDQRRTEREIGAIMEELGYTKTVQLCRADRELWPVCDNRYTWALLLSRYYGSSIDVADRDEFIDAGDLRDEFLHRVELTTAKTIEEQHAAIISLVPTVRKSARPVTVAVAVYGNFVVVLTSRPNHVIYFQPLSTLAVGVEPTDNDQPRAVRQLLTLFNELAGMRIVDQSRGSVVHINVKRDRKVIVAQLVVQADGTPNVEWNVVEDYVFVPAMLDPPFGPTAGNVFELIGSLYSDVDFPDTLTSITNRRIGVTLEQRETATFASFYRLVAGYPIDNYHCMIIAIFKRIYEQSAVDVPQPVYLDDSFFVGRLSVPLWSYTSGTPLARSTPSVLCECGPTYFVDNPFIAGSYDADNQVVYMALEDIDGRLFVERYSVDQRTDSPADARVNNITTDDYVHGRSTAYFRAGSQLVIFSHGRAPAPNATVRVISQPRGNSITFPSYSTPELLIDAVPFVDDPAFAPL